MDSESLTEGTVEILALSARQLAAYNAADLDAFCACFHERVTVIDESGAVTLEGQAAFRARYAAMFSTFRDVRATVSAQLALGPHVVEHEAWSRVSRETSEKQRGLVLVRYSAAEGRIRWVQFFRA